MMLAADLIQGIADHIEEIPVRGDDRAIRLEFDDRKRRVQGPQPRLILIDLDRDGGGLLSLPVPLLLCPEHPA